MSKTKRRRNKENTIFHLQQKVARLQHDIDRLTREKNSAYAKVSTAETLLRGILREHSQVKVARRVAGENVFRVAIDVTPDMVRMLRMDSNGLRHILGYLIESALLEKGREGWGSFVDDSLYERDARTY